MRVKIKRYAGDENLRLLLGEAGCDRPLSLLKAAMLGAQASTESVPMDSVFMEIFSGKGALKPGRDLVDQMESLWYLLYGVNRMPDELMEPAVPAGSTREEFASLVEAHVAAGDLFLKLFHLGDMKTLAADEKFNNILRIYNGNLELLRSLGSSMRNSWKDEDFSGGESFLRKLESFIRVLWDTMTVLKESSKKHSIRKAKNRNIIRSIEDQVGRAIERNEPCPCGSGKKYKACCGR